MNGTANSHRNRWKSIALMVVSGVILAVILAVMFPGKPRIVPQNRPVQVKRAAPSSQLRTPRLSGLWKNSDGDLMELTENGNELKIQLMASDRIIRGHGVLTIRGDRLAGVLTAEFVNADRPMEGDFEGRIAGPDLIEYTVPGRSGFQSHSASMWRVADALRNDVLGKVVAITDGDTIAVLMADGTQVEVRLYGADTPEKDQPFGARAKGLLSSLVAGKSVRVVPRDEDRYQRMVGDVFVRRDPATASATEVRVSLTMVANGLAWHYVQYAPNDTELAAAEQHAKSRKLGLWADPNPIPPWNWRKSGSGK